MGRERTGKSGTAGAERQWRSRHPAADDLNYDSVGAYGCKIPRITPHIDHLAREGMLCNHAHVNIAVCQPSRQSIMTGRYPHRNGAEGFDPIDERVPTLQEHLRSAGYLNRILGKEVAEYFTSVHRGDQSIGAVLKALKESGLEDSTMVNDHDGLRGGNPWSVLAG